MKMDFLESKGKKIFVVGGQAHNSSSYSEAIDSACVAVKKIGGNTVEIPIYWECIEPMENEFCFDCVKSIYKKVHSYGLYLIFLWFGTWKNGTSKYAPSWIKLDRERFWRVIAENDAEIPVLSPHCVETMKMDARAFGKFMKYVKILDPDRETVIAVQVENEPGIMNGPARDFREKVSEIFFQPISQEILDMMETYPKSPVTKLWERNKCQIQNWQMAFKERAQEVFTADAIAAYVNEVAKAGKAEYSDMPLYTNVWVENHRLQLPGKDYPSGGAVSFTLDIWKHKAKNLDFISPDNYQQTYSGYTKCCADYNRMDNPLYIPESGILEWNSRYLFSAVADYKAIGICAFGIESIMKNGEIEEKNQAVAESFKILGALAPGLVRYQGKPVYAIIQEEYAQYQYIEMEDYIAIAYFTNCHSLVGRMGTDWNWHDYRHKDYLERQKRGGCRGRGLIIQSDEKDFFVAGDAFQLILLPKAKEKPLNYMTTSDFNLVRSMDFLSIEEGVFLENGEFQAQRYRNGDEADFGIWVEPDVNVIRVRLC